MAKFGDIVVAVAAKAGEAAVEVDADFSIGAEANGSLCAVAKVPLRIKMVGVFGSLVPRLGGNGRNLRREC